MRILASVFLVVIFNVGFSQEVKFVEEQTLESVKFAPVFVESTNQWYLTDSIGIINFPKLALPFKINIKAMGYVEKEVEISSNKIIYLERSFQALNDVFVKSNSFYSKKWETKNGKLFHGYTFNLKGNFMGFGTIVNFKDSLNWLNKVTFSAQIDGVRNSKLARFRLYKFTIDINKLDPLKPINSGYEEIYSYELKTVFNNPKNKWITFNMPSNIVLENGNYLVSFELIPNQKDNLKVWYSNDKFIHSYYNTVKNFWVIERYSPKPGFYNLKVKLEFDSN